MGFRSIFYWILSIPRNFLNVCGVFIEQIYVTNCQTEFNIFAKKRNDHSMTIQFQVFLGILQTFSLKFWEFSTVIE